jgi:hypothetical protein
VCLVSPVLPLRAGENTKIGGLALNTLKKLKGAKLRFPCLSIVLAKQIGRGPILPNSNWCIFGIGKSEGVNVIMWQS